MPCKEEEGEVNDSRFNKVNIPRDGENKKSLDNSYF